MPSERRRRNLQRSGNAKIARQNSRLPKIVRRFFEDVVDGEMESRVVSAESQEGCYQKVGPAATDLVIGIEGD